MPARRRSNLGSRPRLEIARSGSSDLARWRDGVALPAMIAAAGLFALITGEFPLGRQGRTLSGPPARAIGLMMIFGAALWHVQRFWDENETLAAYALPAKAIAVIGFVAALGWLGFTFL
jgi:hypothetical protein